MNGADCRLFITNFSYDDDDDDDDDYDGDHDDDDDDDDILSFLKVLIIEHCWPDCPHNTSRKTQNTPSGF